MILRQPGGALNPLGWLLLAVGILLSLEGVLWGCLASDSLTPLAPRAGGLYL
jgi:hypothetical protein